MEKQCNNRQLTYSSKGGDAITAYAVGHGIALKLARQAASEKTFEEKRKKLMEAYLYDAFAAHFLTDLFSAGHLRVPRRQLHCKSWDTMAKTKISIGMIFGQDTKEVPIWDHQNRYVCCSFIQRHNLIFLTQGAD